MYISAMCHRRKGGRLGLLLGLVLTQGLLASAAHGAQPRPDATRVSPSSLALSTTPALAEMCAEPAYIRLAPVTAGGPFSFSEGLACLPAGDQLSEPTIEWGDGATSVGTVSDAGMPGGSEQVSGQHTYDSPGSFHISVRVTDLTTGQTLLRGWHTDVDVAQAPLAAPSTSPTPPPSQGGPSAGPNPAAPKASALGVTFHARAHRRRRGRVAALFTTAPAAQLRAMISWGDGSVSRAALRGAPPELQVIARHRWSRPGRYAVTVVVTDAAGQVLTQVTSLARVR